MAKKAILASPEGNFWKAKGNNGKTRVIPFSELTDDHLQRAYFVTQNKTLEHSNKSITFAELSEKLEEEATSRGLTLKSIEDEENHRIGNYFKNTKKLKAK